MTQINTDQIDYLHVMQRVEDATSQKELASEVGFSVGKVNYVIKALLEKGFIKAENFVKSSNKILLTEKYIAIKKREYEKLQESLETEENK